MGAAGFYSGELNEGQPPRQRHLVDGRRSERRYEIKDLQDRHHEMIRMKLKGFDNIAIAEALDVTPENVSVVLNSNIAKQHIAALQGKRDERCVDFLTSMEQMLPKIHELYSNVIEEDKRITPQRERMARDLLDRVGYGKVTKVEGRVRHAHLTMEDIAGIKEGARASVRTIENEADDD